MIEEAEKSKKGAGNTKTNENQQRKKAQQYEEEDGRIDGPIGKQTSTTCFRREAAEETDEASARLDARALAALPRWPAREEGLEEGMERTAAWSAAGCISWSISSSTRILKRQREQKERAVEREQQKVVGNET